jgi:hypothetical protein
MITFLAPPAMCAFAAGPVTNRRVALGEDLYRLVANDDGVALNRHRLGEPAGHRVVLEQVGHGLQVAEVVRRDHFEAPVAALLQGLEEVPTDPPEPVNANSNGHRTSLRSDRRS